MLEVHGTDVQADSRCAHYAAPWDVVAMRLPCCRTWWGCRRCHDESADHPARTWQKAETDGKAVAACGACTHTMDAATYLSLDHDAPRCPACNTAFNPGCVGHRHLYFDL